MNKPNNQSSLDNWIDWLMHLHAQEIDLGLTRIAKVASDMQLLTPAPLVITVAGTNGKGSSVAMLCSILQAAGYKVGAYTSPHIISFTERIKINGKQVTEQAIVNAFNQIENQRAQTKLTYFEFSTLAAINIFSQTDLDVVVLEVGLGGRLDAVNIVDANATLITAIDVDHVDWLGDDRNLIAVEKAGVMRTNQISVCSDPDVPTTLIAHANTLGTKLSVLNRDFSYQLQTDDWQLKQQAVNETYAMPALKGDFQIQNAAGVVMLLQQLVAANKINLNQAQINQGLANVSHAGRLEHRDVAGQSWLIDVAHNPQSAEVLASYLEQTKAKDLVAIFSALNDKDMAPMVKAIAPFVKQWHIADLDIARSSSIERLNQILLQADVSAENIVSHDNMAQAVSAVKNEALTGELAEPAAPENKVLVWGSFFTVAQVIETLESLKEMNA